MIRKTMGRLFTAGCPGGLPLVILGLAGCVSPAGLPERPAAPEVWAAFRNGDDLHTGCRPGVPTRVRGVLYSSEAPGYARVYELHDDPRTRDAGAGSPVTGRILEGRALPGGRVFDPGRAPVWAVSLAPAGRDRLLRALDRDRGADPLTVPSLRESEDMRWVVSGCRDGVPFRYARAAPGSLAVPAGFPRLFSSPGLSGSGGTPVP